MNIDHLKDKFDLNELEVSILTYIKKNQKNLKNITIRQMAKDNFTSTSAIYRLCNKLKFSGYSDLIYHLSDNHHTHISTKNFEHYVPQFNQLLKKHQNSRIIVFGMPIVDVEVPSSPVGRSVKSYSNAPLIASVCARCHVPHSANAAFPAQN